MKNNWQPQRAETQKKDETTDCLAQRACRCRAVTSGCGTPPAGPPAPDPPQQAEPLRPDPTARRPGPLRRARPAARPQARAPPPRAPPPKKAAWRLREPRGKADLGERNQNTQSPARKSCGEVSPGEPPPETTKRSVNDRQRTRCLRGGREENKGALFCKRRAAARATPRRISRERRRRKRKRKGEREIERERDRERINAHASGNIEFMATVLGQAHRQERQTARQARTQRKDRVE